MKIKISKDFSDTPSGRYEKDSPFSGERFYRELLLPRFEHCHMKNKFLTIDFDDCYGFTSVFLEEVFCSLRKLYSADEIFSTIRLISTQDPMLIGIINEIVYRQPHVVKLANDYLSNNLTETVTTDWLISELLKLIEK